MLKLVDCLAVAHDPRLVALAVTVCALSSITAVELAGHARGMPQRARIAWLGVASCAGGSGIWATHFVAMLAFEPGVAAGYDTGLTALSLVIAIVMTGLGLGVALGSTSAVAAWLGGSIHGAGIAAMHITGMAAYQIAGHESRDLATLLVAVVLGVLFSGAASALAFRGAGPGRRACGAFLLLLAVCTHHFVATSAVTVVPDPTIIVPEATVPNSWLAAVIALVSLAILLAAGAGLALDIRDRRHALLEGERLRSLANAAVEGLVVCSDGVIVCANRSFAQLVGSTEFALTGVLLSAFLSETAPQPGPTSDSGQTVEAELRQTDGHCIPVELIWQPLERGDQRRYAVAVRDLRARRQAEGHIQFLAHHDPLTGLANRMSFAQRLDQEMKLADTAGRKLAVLCLDLDRFKEVNDLLGHAAGDSMLVMVARSVTGLLDETQMMARLGGDEFAVLMQCENSMAAGRMAERIIEGLQRDRETAGPVIATSVGIALYPDDAGERALLLNYADMALYRAKSEARGTYRFFEARMGAQVRERRVLEHDMRHAVARGEMHLAYQPQTDVRTGAVTGFEVLLRWQHPERGAVSPALFIPIAEESNAILQIGEWVLREACREAASWPNPLTVAVNVSAVQLLAPHFAATVHEVLFQTGLPAERLEIEITETALIRDPSRAQSTLRQLKALGLRIAMDDFGTGYSSLSNLRAYPFDKIKIDGSFIRAVDANEQTAAIVRSVLGLGRGLGLPVLAEGIETAEELRFLAEEQCHAAQGYLIGRPGPIDQFARHTHGEPPVAPPQHRCA
ncbi:EAL domain-containing protein [uncultured Methylobacterium sp.]|uniref:sensor domain-containing diguanylate cyclase n=1 Tax=uncultured Methylobacterium sp. TaxID=157278 RepID=UPI002595D377|nr:EAL domain-containing protein [uncultured Methylobacterium sp.]